MLNRLKDHGIDVYVDGHFDSMRDRLAWVLTENRWGPIICGTHAGKPESYEQRWERLYGMKLKDAMRAIRSSHKQPAAVSR